MTTELGFEKLYRFMPALLLETLLWVNILRHTEKNTAAHCNNTLQRTGIHCNTLQHTAIHCNTLQHTAAHCNTLQHTAAHCSTLQHTAAHCSTLHHPAPHCNTCLSRHSLRTPSAREYRPSWNWGSSLGGAPWARSLYAVVFQNKQKILKVSSLLNVQCKMNTQITFEKLCLLWGKSAVSMLAVRSCLSKQNKKS